MILNAKYLAFIFVISYILFCSVYLFSKGFLLTRNEIQGKSSCQDFKEGQNQNGKDGCWMPKVYKKAIIMIIDGLRYDFAHYDNTVNGKDSMYLNKMETFHKLLASGKNNAFFKPFIADAPTTTMQRLKGLTTGSLPTFIDVGMNFASEEILEDNLIDQLRSHDTRIVVLGDDTWGNLFPGRFHRSMLFDSFNVKDLDTVDNGVLKHMFLEIEKPDWELIILHFLGVDHAGHTFGLDHPRMREKLLQMDFIVSNLSSTIDRETLLVVMGDHGMTLTGDHGGASNSELKSAIFAYSPSLQIPSSASKSKVPISQIDLVPTLSLLLGSPIPYSNIGTVIEGLFSPEIYDLALKLNVNQISRYFNAYQEQFREFPQDRWNEIAALLSKIDKTDDVEFKKLAENFLNLAKITCEEIWAKFDDGMMVSGIFSLLCGTIFTLSISFSNRNLAWLFSYFVILNICCFLIPFSIPTSLFAATMSIIILFMLSKCAPQTYRKNIINTISIIFFAFFALTSFSNSFVVAENYIGSFFLCSVLLFISLSLIIKRYRYFSKMKQKHTLFGLYEIVVCLCVFIAFISIRLSSRFWRCREEQYWCRATPLVHTSMGGLPAEARNTRFFSSISFLICMIYLMHKWLSFCGNLNGVTFTVLIAKFVPNLNGVLIASFWALEGVQTPSKSISLASLYLPRILFIVTFVSLLFTYFKPLLIFLLPRAKSGTSYPHLSSESVIPHIFKKLKNEYSKASNSSPPVVYGLATGVSSTLCCVFIQIILVLIIITGDGMIGSVFLWMLTTICCLVLVSLLSWTSLKYSDDMLSPPCFASIVLWFLLSLYGFYTTGHISTFSAIDWAAGFVGYNEGKAHWMPALLITMSTFSSHFLFGLLLPLIYVTPFTIGALWPSLVMDKTQSEDAKRGEFLLVEGADQAHESLTHTALSYLAIHGIKVLFTCIASLVLKRHLMTWKIFAPHFIFEAVGFGMSCFGVLLGQIFVMRTISALETWSQTLIEKNE